jgi:hypothetical protein
MHPHSDLRRETVRRAVLGEGPLDRHGAFQCGPGVLERHEEPVPRVADLLALVLREEGAKRPVVPPDHVLPCFVPDRLDQVRRALDVREHERLDHPRPGATTSFLERVEPLQVEDGAKLLQRAARRPELSSGGVLVSSGAIGQTDADPSEG